MDLVATAFPDRSSERPGMEMTSGREELAVVYERHFDDVCRWLRAMGGPERELEDLAQETFLVARRKYDRFDGRNVAGWLYRIAWRVMADARRRVWLRRMVFGGEALAEIVDERPGESVESFEARRTLRLLLARMNVERRTTLVLFEIEGYSTEEIAALQGIQVATVSTRLLRARRELLEMTRALRAKTGERP
jgi:RNA polymerase sigma-70 factor (ECF subfamily)